MELGKVSDFPEVSVNVDPYLANGQLCQQLQSCGFQDKMKGCYIHIMYISGLILLN